MRVRFGDFALDTGTRELTRSGAVQALSSKAFDLLALLVADRPRIVSKARLQEQLWPDRFVVEKNLANLVCEIRAALGEDASNPRFIRTAHRFGYAFRTAGDTTLPGDPESPPNACGCRLIWRGQRMTLGDGCHTIGRDPNADIYLASTSVSRRHASIRISDGQAMLEDLGSKNGTFVGKSRIDAITALADGDRIRIGSIELTFRILQGVGSTRTSADEE
jgi:DNA-binding winged helix-turn-helix (wHTH) protein